MIRVGPPGLVAIMKAVLYIIRFKPEVLHVHVSAMGKFLYVGLFGILGILLLKILRKDIYRLLPPLILPNTGNMGMPICLFAYGKLGLAIAAAVTTVIVVFHFTLNILLASRKFSIKPLINCVSIYALIISLFFVYFISGIAETNRHPFDVAEGESEIVAGFHVEYSGAAFAIFFLAEYANMLLIATLTSIMFLGGWESFFAGSSYLMNTSMAFLMEPSILWLAAKISFFIFVFFFPGSRISILNFEKSFD